VKRHWRTKGFAGAIVVVVVAILVTSTSEAGDGSSTAEEPSLVSEMLSPEDLPPGFLLGRDTIPHEAFFRSTAPFANEVRDAVLVDARLRSLELPDRSENVTVQVEHYVNEEVADEFVDPRGTLGAGPDALADSARYDQGARERDYAEVASQVQEAGVVITIEVIAAGEDAAARADRLLVTTTRTQAELLSPRATLPYEGLNTGSLRLEMADRTAGLLMITLLVLGLVTFLRDGAARRRLLQRFQGRGVVPRHAIDINAQAAHILHVSLGARAARGVFLVVLVFVTLFVPIGIWGAIALLVVGTLGWGWLETRVLLRRSSVSGLQIFRGWTWLLGAAGTTVTLAMLAFAALLAWVGILFQIFGALDLTEEQLSAIREILLLVAVVLAALAILPLRLVRRLAFRLLAKDMADDLRPPFLFLRSFADDRLMLRSHRSNQSSLLDRLTFRRWERFEEVVAIELSSDAPVVAVAERGTLLPPLGAARRLLDPRTWQAHVDALLPSCEAVILIAGRSEGLGWELARLRDDGHLGKTVVLIPPVAREEARARLLALSEVMRITPAALDWEQPGVETVAVVFDQVDDGRIFPIPIVSRARDDVSYRVALQVARETLAWLEIGGEWWAPELRSHTPAHRFRRPLWWPAGRAPRARPWYRRFSILVWALALPIMILAALLGRLTGPVAPVERQLLVGTAPGMILNDASSSAMYAIDGAEGTVHRLEMGSGTSERVGQLDLDAVVEGTVSDGWVLAASPLHDEVAALSLEDGTQWTRSFGDAPRSVLVHDGRGFVALAGDEAVIELDLETGQEVARVDVAGAYGLAAQGEDLLVSSAPEDEVVVLDGELEPSSTRTAVAPRALVGGGDGIYAWDERDGALWHLDGGGALDRPTSDTGGPLLASNGREIAISTDLEQGQIEVLSADGGGVTRYVLDSPASSIGLTDEGRLLATYTDYTGVYLVAEPDL